MLPTAAFSRELAQQSVRRICSLAREDKLRLDQEPKGFLTGISSRLQWELQEFNNYVMAITLIVSLGYARDEKGDPPLTVQEAVTTADPYHTLSSRMQFVSSCVANYDDIHFKTCLQAVSWQVHSTLAHLLPQ